MIPGLNDGEAELKTLAQLADELDMVEGLDVFTYVPYGVNKARRLGLKVYEAPLPPPEYGQNIVAKLASFMHKPIKLQ